MYSIPLFNLNFDEKEVLAATETIKNGWISMGPKCIEFEKKFAEKIGSKYSCAVANCTAALHLACISLGVKEGDEVICPSLTFAATVNCIRYVGAKPVFADIVGKNDLCIDAKKIESLITPNTKAIIIMHYAGFACDIDSVLKIAKKHNLKIIEDACHAPLSEYRGKKVGTIGDVGCFSFFSNKNISTGEGGMIVTDDEEIYNRIKLLRSHGMTTMSYQRSTGHAVDYDIIDLGFNYRMDDIRASIGIVQLDKLYDDIKKRGEVREWYVDELHNKKGIIIPFVDRNNFSSNYIFPIVLEDSDKKKRDNIRKELQKKGVQTSVHYPAVHKFSIYSEYEQALPITEYVSDNEITLPMYGRLDRDKIKYICKSLKTIIEDNDG